MFRRLLRIRRGRRAAVVGGAVIVAAGLVLLQTSAGSGAHRADHSAGVVAATGGGGPCGAHRAPPARYDHVIWITFENQSGKDVIGKRSLPALNRIARQCGLATNFHAEAHPSLPNYIAMTSGGTQGINGDSSGPLQADNIYAQVTRSGRQWRHYAFGMPSNCDHSDAPSTDRAIYTAHHQPPIFYTNIAADCARWDVGVGDPSKVVDPSDVRRGPLADALSRGTLPAFTTIEPTDDGGNSNAGGEVDPVKGDAFLARWIPRITSSRAYRSGRTAIFVTWDEPGDFKVNPPHDTIPTLVIAPTVPRGARVGTRFDHYALLRTTEQMLGIHTFLGAAAGARSMRAGFHA